MNTQSEQRQRTILIVEDNRTQAEYLRFIVAKTGHTVLVSPDGRSALSCISRKRPDLILTDIVMPELDGYSLCSAIKRDPSLADIPVVLVTTLFAPIDVIHHCRPAADP